MILAAHQPQFMPWLGYFDKMRASDVFVLLDSVQYKKNEWQNRNKILTPQGPRWLTVPVVHEFGEKITEVRINDEAAWKPKHLKTLAQSYSKADFFSSLMPELEKFYGVDYCHLSEIAIASVRFLAGRLRLVKQCPLLSENPVEGSATQRLVSLCRRFQADTYLAGSGGKDYMDMPLFEKAGIRVVFQEYKHPSYNQFSRDFTPCLSALDLMFHAGDKAFEIY